MSVVKKAQRVTVSLDEQDYAILAGLSEQHDVSMSWLIRQAVSDYISRRVSGDVQLRLGLSGQRRNGE